MLRIPGLFRLCCRLGISQKDVNLSPYDRMVKRIRKHHCTVPARRFNDDSLVVKPVCATGDPTKTGPGHVFAGEYVWCKICFRHFDVNEEVIEYVGTTGMNSGITSALVWGKHWVCTDIAKCDEALAAREAKFHAEHLKERGEEKLAEKRRIEAVERAVRLPDPAKPHC